MKTFDPITQWPEALADAAEFRRTHIISPYTQAEIEALRIKLATVRKSGSGMIELLEEMEASNVSDEPRKSYD